VKDLVGSQLHGVCRWQAAADLVGFASVISDQCHFVILDVANDRDELFCSVLGLVN
jgi:hypothetical protein